MPVLEASLALLLAVPFYLNIILVRGRAVPGPRDAPRPGTTAALD